MWYRFPRQHFFIDTKDRVWHMRTDGHVELSTMAAEFVCNKGFRIDKPLEPWADACLRALDNAVKPKYDARRKLCFSYVLPTRSLRALVKTKLLKMYPELNYCCEWNDTRGFGILLTVANWKGKQPGVYNVPN